MAFGVLEPSQPDHHGHTQIPGTVQLFEDDDSHIALNPTPSQSINDPLRWPKWKKLALLVSVSLGCALAGIEGTFLAVATLPITEELGITITQTQSFTSYPFLGIAVGCALSAIFARVFGKRPVYLISAVIGLAATAWNSRASTYSSFLGARVIYGITAGTFEAMPFASIGDLFFVHQRGRAMSFFGFMALGTTQIAPVLAGYLTDKYGWRSIFYALIPFRALVLLCTVFLVPETSFHRDTEQVKPRKRHTSSPPATRPRIHHNGSKDSPSTESCLERRRPYIIELAPFRRIHSGTGLWAATVQFFIVGLYPIVWFAFIPCGTYLAWYLGINITLAQIFGAPPINFTPTSLGYINTFGLPGAILAEANLHAFADSTCRLLAKRNDNIHEPEFRLFMIAPAVLVALLAYPLYGWYAGVLALEQEISWVAASVLFGLAIFSLVQGQSVAFAYLLDAHQNISIEAGMFVVMLRSFFTYGATTFVPIWIEHSGIADAFYEIAGLQAGLIVAATCCMYIFGKRVRAFVNRHDPVEKFRAVVR